MADDITELLQRRLTAAQAQALVSGSPVQLTGLMLPLAEWMKLGAINVAPDGTLVWAANSSGLRKIDAPTTSDLSNVLQYTAQLGSNPITQDPTGIYGGTYSKYARRLGLLKITTAGAGAGTGALVPAVSDATGVAELLGIWFGASDASNTWTIAVTGGTLVGPGSYIIAGTQYAVTQFGAIAAGGTGFPIPVSGTNGTDDNKEITIAVAGAAATTDHYVIYRYWYE